MKRALVAVVAGGIAFFVLGGLIYEVVLGGFYQANLGSATGVLRNMPIGWALVVSQLGLAAVVTYVFVHADVTTAAAGLKTGTIFGLSLCDHQLVEHHSRIRRTHRHGCSNGSWGCDYRMGARVG
jgi:hypothetical protein